MLKHAYCFNNYFDQHECNGTLSSGKKTLRLEICLTSRKIIGPIYIQHSLEYYSCIN